MLSHHHHLHKHVDEVVNRTKQVQTTYSRTRKVDFFGPAHNHEPHQTDSPTPTTIAGSPATDSPTTASPTATPTTAASCGCRVAGVAAAHAVVVVRLDRPKGGLLAQLDDEHSESGHGGGGGGMFDWVIRSTISTLNQKEDDLVSAKGSDRGSDMGSVAGD